MMGLSTEVGFWGNRVPQFSVFLQNRVGALLEIVKLINEHSLEVLALTVHDSTDCAVARLIVTDPDQARNIFRDADIAFAVSGMLVVELPESAEELGQVLATLLAAEVNVHAIYPMLTRPRGKAALAMHVEDDECASTVLRAQGFTLLSQSNISR